MGNLHRTPETRLKSRRGENLLSRLNGQAGERVMGMTHNDRQDALSSTPSARIFAYSLTGSELL